MKVFEDTLFPQNVRWEYAFGNVANDIALDSPLRNEITRRAETLYPTFLAHKPLSRIGMLSLFLPVGCNATCPNICFTDIANWRKLPDHVTLSEILAILLEFKNLGGKLVRIVGDGEPILYPQFADICQWIRQQKLALLIFSNGVRLTKPVFEEYQRGSLYVYVKLWSECAGLQNMMVAPRIPYRFLDGCLGPAPDSFYQLYEIDKERVGFQILCTKINEQDAARIVEGPKQQVSLFVDSFVTAGSGKEHEELISDSTLHLTRPCSMPPRASYLAIINSLGRLQAGTFVEEEAVSVKGGQLREVWRTAFASRRLFMESRYSGGYFCETMRNSLTPSS